MNLTRGVGTRGVGQTRGVPMGQKDGLGRVKTGSNSIDTKQFWMLLRRHRRLSGIERRENFATICLLIQQIVVGAARMMWFPTADDRCEAISSCLEYCLSRRHKFKPDRSANPAGYFDRMAYRRLAELRKSLLRRQGREITGMISDEGEIRSTMGFGRGAGEICRAGQRGNKD